MTEKEIIEAAARLRAFPLDADEIRPDRWYAGKEFWKTHYKRGPINVSKSAWYVGVAEGKFPEGRKIGHERFYFGGHILAIRKGKDWRKVAEPEKIIL